MLKGVYGKNDYVVVLSTYHWDIGKSDPASTPVLLLYSLEKQELIDQIKGGLVLLKFLNKTKEIIYMTHEQWVPTNESFKLKTGEKRATQPNLIDKFKLNVDVIDESSNLSTSYSNGCRSTSLIEEPALNICQEKRTDSKKYIDIVPKKLNVGAKKLLHRFLPLVLDDF